MTPHCGMTRRLPRASCVLLAHRQPLAGAKEIFCDPASLTSVNLLKVLLAERGLKPEFKPLESYEAAKGKDFVLLIGDAALDFARAPHAHEIFDLGAVWFELTNLPFVYAVWALRRGIENKELRESMGKKAQAKALADYTTKNSHSSEYYAYLKGRL